MAGTRRTQVTRIEPVDCGLRTGARFVEWLGANRPWLEDRLLEHGAVLFRGFGIEGHALAQAFSEATTDEPMSGIGGAAIRHHLQGRLFSSSAATFSLHLGVHTEWTYRQRYPARLAFFCQVPPSRGGETALLDMQLFHDVVPERIRAALARRGWALHRTVPAGRPDEATSWAYVFQTTDPGEVEDACRKQGVEFRWLPHGALRLVNRTPPFQAHPVTGRPTWTSHVQASHDSQSWELWRMGQRRQALRRRLGEIRRLRWDAPTPEQNFVTFADGGRIPYRWVRTLRRLVRQHQHLHAWQRGDVVVLDNQRVGHGREPHAGRRELWVCLSDPRDGSSASLA